MRRASSTPAAIALLALLLHACGGQNGPSADQLYVRWQAEVAAAGEADPDEAATFEAELLRRVALEQAARRGLGTIQTSRAADDVRRQAASLAWVDLRRMDEDNLRFLTPHIPDEGWFRKSRTEPRVAHAAWLIVQHSSDVALQNRVLESMGTLLPENEVDGEQYALLYDRVKVARGNPQRYGTQALCRNGVLVVGELESADNIDELREAAGFELTFEQYKKAVGIGGQC